MRTGSVVHLECGLSLASLRHEHPSFPLAIAGLWFSTDQAEHAEWLAATSFITHTVSTRVPRERRILIVSEPRGNFTPAYLNQFGILISPFAVPGYRGAWHQSHGALSLWFGAGHAGGPPDYAALMDLEVPKKSDTISVVTSRKSVLAGHRRRLDFLRALRRAIGSRLLVFGRGFELIADKAEAILPSKYHLVLENTVMPAYWTEKLADAYIGYALPVVSGPPDLERWFPRGSFVPIDIEDTKGAIEVIARVLDDDIYANHFEAIVAARNRLMRYERLCPVVARVIDANPSSAPTLSVSETITPMPRAPLAQRVQREVARFYWQMDERVRELLAR